MQQALGDAFLLERELKGGMSRVFVAREKALGRRVVLKVLPPDVAASVSTERFQREIQVAARLQHPHIVPLLNAGRSGEFLYYTMPLVEGESLRERLVNRGELPVRIAVRIISEVARALAYAHRNGIVHRDIKPDNILLTDDEAQVTDFGIAKAITASSEYGLITSVGVALGTPLYMAPEQATADPTTDARADLYSLGCVAYEMLAGQPPFQGRTAAQLLAAHATERPVAVRDRRRAVPVALGDTIMQLLEKRPADRPQTAEELLSVLEVSQAAADPAPTERLSSSGSAVSARSLAPQRGRWVIAAAAMLAVVLLLAWLTRRHPSATVDRSVVAVAPFRVSGADSSLGYLREGMVDLLAAKLSGTSGIRAADPRTLLAAWRRKAKGSGDLREQDAIEVAERIGAGRLIEGDVVGNRQRININAAVLDAADHRVTAQASVEGSPDSLTRLVDQLAIKLLALEAGESEQRLPNLTSTSLPALRAYLEGQELMRRGEFKQAYERFRLAIQQDSTFGLAALGEMRAAGWIASGREDFAQALAWKYRDRLSPVDRALLEVYVGSRPPAPPRWSEAVTSAERLVRLAPDNAEAWYELGDGLYHYGPLIGLADAGKRAAQAFAKSIALDSSFAPALEHGPLLALSLGDTSGARTALARTMRIDSTSAIAAASRWLMAMVTGDSASRRQLLQSDSLGAGYMISLGLSAGVPIEDAAAVLARKRAVAVTADEQARVQRDARNQALITGWPSRAPPPPTDRPEPLRKTLLYIEGRWGDGDSVAGAAAADALLKTIGTPLAVGDYLAAERYTAGQRAYDRGRLDLAQRAIADLRSLPASEDSAWVREIPSGLALLLEAQLAARQNSPGLPNLLARLDSALIDASSFTLSTMGNLIIARLYERQGNLPAALAAIHRRLWNLSSTAIYLTYYREEGRLAALNGDREGAIKAYRRYLALRSGAEPRLQPQLAQVRAELQALERESTDR